MSWGSGRQKQLQTHALALPLLAIAVSATLLYLALFSVFQSQQATEPAAKETIFRISRSGHTAVDIVGWMHMCSLHAELKCHAPMPWLSMTSHAHACQVMDCSQVHAWSLCPVQTTHKALPPPSHHDEPPPLLQSASWCLVRVGLELLLRATKKQDRKFATHYPSGMCD